VKRLTLLGLVVLAIVVGSAVIGPAAMAAQNKDGLERIIFVHYPKNVKPDHPTPSGGKASLCPDASTCPDYKYSGYRWSASNPSVQWAYDLSGVNGSTSGFAAAISAAFATWDGWTKASLFGGGSSPSCVAGTKDGVNCVSWQNISSQYPHAIAVTFVWANNRTKAIAEADTVMNTGDGYTWDSTTPSSCSGDYCDPSNAGPSSSYDVQNILTHEVGHWLMLNDLYTNQDVNLTMYGYGSKGELKKDTLGYGDVLGVQKIYGK
jgi:hypothetical protein